MSDGTLAVAVVVGAMFGGGIVIWYGMKFFNGAVDILKDEGADIVAKGIRRARDDRQPEEAPREW